MTDQTSGIAFRMSTVEAWELVGFLTTSRTPELKRMAARLENQLRTIQQLEDKLQQAKKKVIEEECIQGTGYMCTGCAMPVPEGEILSSCCNYPVVLDD